MNEQKNGQASTTTGKTDTKSGQASAKKGKLVSGMDERELRVL